MSGGDEYVREAVRTYLETAVPTRLAAELAADGLTSPSTDIAFLLQDVLEGVESFPAVLVKSTLGEIDKWVATRTFWMDYTVELIVACDHRVHGSYEGASTDRDRVLRAVRGAVLTMSGLPNDINVNLRTVKWVTGAAVQTLAGVPLAAGTLTFDAKVEETISVLDPPEDMDAADLTVTGVDADTDLDTD